MERRIYSVLLVIATAIVTASASADVVKSSYISGSQYEFEIDDMPDFDQVRDTLGVDGNGDPGGMYCVPTSQVNLLGYIATHGYEDAGPNAADWEQEEDYSLVTTFVSNQASLCNTDPLNGSGHEDAFFAIEYFLNARVPGVFTVTGNLATNTTGPTLRSISENNINGAISMMAYGIYDSIGTDFWGRLVLDRNGGHAVTFARGFRDGDDREVGYRDPDDSNNSATQSPFTLTQFDVEPVEFVSAGTLAGAFFQGKRTGSRIMRGNTRYRMIDSVIHVRPRGCYTWDSSENQFTIVWAGQLGDYDPSTILPGPIASGVNDLTIGPFNNSLWYAEQELGSVWQVELANQNATEFVLPHEVLQLEFARDHSLIYLGKQEISRIHPYAEPGENMPQPQTVVLPWNRGYIAAAIDDMDNTCWFADDQDIFRIPANLEGAPNQLEMPEQWPQNLDIRDLAVTGIPEMPISILGGDGRVMLCAVGGNGQLIMKDLVWPNGDIASIQFNDERDLIAYSQEGIQLFRMLNGDWTPVEDHPFKGRVFSGKAVMAMSRSNFNPELHTGEKWRHVRDVVGPAADLDGNGVVNIDDLLILLGNFGSQGDGDLDGDGTVTIDDLLELLSKWTV